MRRLRPNRLTVRLTLASVGSAAAIGLVCAVALVSLRNLSTLTRAAVTRQIAVLNDTAAFQALLYQKGFAAEYMLTRDPMWLGPLEASRSTFSLWLVRAHAGAGSATGRQLLERIEREYDQYDGSRREAIAAFEGDDIEIRAILKLKIPVTEALHEVGGHWEMTAKGVKLRR